MTKGWAAMRLDSLVNFLLDANIAILIAAVAVMVSERALSFLGYARSYKIRLRLVMVSIYILALLPLFLFFLGGAIGPQIPSFSDMLVSQYLKGNISMAATEFDSLLSLRQRAVQMVSDGSNLLLLGVALLLLAAAISRAGYVAFSCLRVLKIIKNGVTIKSIRRVRVIVSDEIHVPFSTRSLFRYYVVLPQSMLMDAKLQKISLGHELQHIRQKDINCEITATLVSPLFVLNPAFWYLVNKVRSLREFACDFAYLRKSRCTPRSYAKGLVQVAEMAFVKQPKRAVYAFSVPLVGRNQLFSRSAKSGLQERIMIISEGEGNNPGSVLIGGLVVTVFAILHFGIAAMQQSRGWSYDRIMVSSVANLERLNLLNSSE